ncbi:MAG: phospholipid carrier-dependent glycosyltransferase [Parcubacteria group bacterium]|jgi:4-amino-4-deoxy-L-arabinose transferase-like glycosyltransferase
MKKSIHHILIQPYLGISLLLLVFLLKGFLFVTILPIFQGPDEPIHYATIQYFAEPKEKNWDIQKIDKEDFFPDGDNTNTYHYSQEIKKTAEISQFDEIKFHGTNTSLFLSGSDGAIEQTLPQASWKKYIDSYPPSIVGGPSLYYLVTSQIEKFFSSSDILVRFFSIRIFSVFLGILTVLLAYLTTLKAGFTQKQALVISTIIAFQPMFTQTAAIINYDIPLIFAFSLFTYATVALLRHGFQWKYFCFLFLGALVGILVKGTGLILPVLIFPILIYLIYQKTDFGLGKKKFFFYLSALFVIAIAFFIIFGPKGTTEIFTDFSATSNFSSPLESLQKYIVITAERWDFFELTYWGSFGWLDAQVSDYVLIFIWLTEIVALAGIVYAFFFKKIPSSFLPEKKYIIFMILMLVALQGLIRFYDWKIFYSDGSIIIGTPGRYFLPNIISHFLVLFFGLGSFFSKKKHFDILLITSLILMIGFFFYSLFNIIIPRYYL